MPYEVIMEGDDTAFLRCWGTMTNQHAYDFLSEIYHGQDFINAKFFIRDYLEVTEVVTDEDLPTYAAMFESVALKNLNKKMVLAIVAQGVILPALDDYIEILLEASPESIIKSFSEMSDARQWVDAQR